MLEKGTRVRMSVALKQQLFASGSHAHVVELGECVGVVEGFVDYGAQQGPEVDVRWEPSGLRYGYAPEGLEVVDAT